MGVFGNNINIFNDAKNITEEIEFKKIKYRHYLHKLQPHHSNIRPNTPILHMFT